MREEGRPAPQRSDDGKGWGDGAPFSSSELMGIPSPLRITPLARRALVVRTWLVLGANMGAGWSSLSSCTE